MIVEKQNRELSPQSVSPKQRHAFSLEDKRPEVFSQRVLIQAMHNGSRRPIVPQTMGTVAQMTKINMESLINILKNIVLSDIVTNLSIQSEEEHPVIKLPIKDYILLQIQYLESHYPQLPDTIYNALLLSCVMNSLAEIVTLKETVLRFRPRIAQKLITYFQNDLQQNMQAVIGDQGGVALTLEIAKSLNNEDPIELYLKKIIPVGEAAMMICNAAPKLASPRCMDYFQLLVYQFKCRILAINREIVTKSQPGKRAGGGSSFELKDVVGYISTEFFDYVNGGSGYDAAGDFVIDENIETSLAQLREAIDHRIKHSDHPHVPALIENSAQNIRYSNCCLFLQEIMQCTPEKALTTLTYFRAFLLSLPIQVSVPHSVWFSSMGFKSAVGTHYKPMAALIKKQRAIADMILSPDAKTQRGNAHLPNVTVEILALAEAAQLYERPIEYAGWRMDKDSRSAQRELAFADCPVFGALCFWDTQKYRAGMTNIYGNLNFYLSTAFKQNNRQKIHYKATVTSPERVEILDMIEDLARDRRYHYLIASLLARFLGKGDLRFPTTELEVIIYGGFDIQSDTDMNINIGDSSGIPQDVIGRMKLWALGQDKKIQETDNKYGSLNYATNQKNVLLKIQVLEVCIREILRNTVWNNMGKGVFGLSKEPTGIRKLREIFNTPDSPTNNKLEKMKEVVQKRLQKNTEERNEFVQNLYETLNKINPAIIPEVSGEEHLDAVYLECSQFAAALIAR